jgi:lactoylglutathione lyase
MTTSMTYAIKFVGNMDAAVRFHVAQLGLQLRFQSPEWSEFETGQTTLALHQASAEHPAGSCELGFGVPDIERFFAAQTAQGTQIVQAPSELHGRRIMKVRDADGAEVSVSGAD